ncbi:hypothetical protein J8273_0504 [Carpediemonas membranifera]|uniref:Uncharacterized protein n=1 Tax=Carpediemonas membranifera TaxID=201153 RepID=A0A8J6BDL2_9EUKA|nr:hypothetical protein J8273_0504 [Carpediemonas membranifera]|eukprot:KAG9395277.1 hypothetical protein J8273_0504 [Carpediemonas membranifera]
MSVKASSEQRKNTMPGDKPNKTVSDSLKEAKDQIKDATVDAKDKVVHKSMELKEKMQEQLTGKKTKKDTVAKVGGVKVEVERTEKA